MNHKNISKPVKQEVINELSQLTDEVNLDIANFLKEKLQELVEDKKQDISIFFTTFNPFAQNERTSRSASLDEESEDENMPLHETVETGEL